MYERAIVLAAGKSTRIATVAGCLPKPLIEIAGEPILVRNLRWLAQSGIKEVWINLHYRPEAIRDRIGDGSGFGLEVNYSYEPEILGTAGGVRKIALNWTEAFVVVYGDSLLRADLRVMQKGHERSGTAVTIGLFDRLRQPHTGIAGGTVAVSESGYVLSFIEGTSTATSALVNAGLYIVQPDLLQRIPPNTFYDFARDLFPQLLNLAVPINSHVIEGYCLGIDTPEAYRQAVRLIDEGRVRL